MEGASAKSLERQRWFRWLVPAALILVLATCSWVEPMRWVLPPRYLFKHLDIHRTGFSDYTMCMRAELTPSEAQDFVARFFGPEERVEHPVPMHQTLCPAPFWPNSFRSNTMGLKIEYWPDGWVEGSTGAVYENGFLYFWSNTM